VKFSLPQSSEIEQAEIPAALAALAALQGALAARLLVAPVVAPANGEGDTMLTTKEAAKLLCRSPRWIYRHKHLPFVKPLSARSMVHSKRGIERYLATRKS